MEWKRANITLRYDLGDIKLFEKQLSGIVCQTHFLELAGDTVSNLSASILSKHDVDAAQIVSCPISGMLKTIDLCNGAIIYCTSRYHHHYIDTQVSFENYQQKFKSKTRSTLKKKVVKFLEEDPGNFFRKFATESEIEAFIGLAGVVSSKTYQHHLFGRGLPQSREFIEEAKRQAKDGLVRGYLLYYHGKPIAYTYGPVMGNGVFLFDYNGYDPDYSKLSPGNVLQFKTIEDLCSDLNIEVYDLCIGENEHKILFSGASKYCADILILKISFRNICLVVSNVSVSMISKFMGDLLQHLKLKSWLKRVIRRNAGGEGQVNEKVEYIKEEA